MASKLYVGGLSSSTTSDQLRTHFQQSGTVVSAAVVTERDSGQSRGFGFVEMATDAEAETAIAKLNQQDPGLHVSTILLTMYDGRTRLSAQVAEEVRTHFPDQVLRTSVPRSVRISEAPSFGQTVMTYDPNSSGALSYLEAAGELADRGASGQPV